MKIGITCYPTFGGSGVVATELGHELARRGHDVHFITYAMPSRLNIFLDRVTYHEVTVPSYPLFQYAPYDLALATRMGDVATHEGLDLIHVHYALPHAISAHLAREMLAPRRLGLVTTLHGTDVTIVGQDRSYLPITRFGIEKSDAVTAVSVHLKKVTIDVFQPKREIEVIPNFINPKRWTPESPQLACRFVPEGRKVLMHVSNFRPVKRVLDVVEVFDRLRQRVPATLVMIGDGPDRPAALALEAETVNGRVTATNRTGDLVLSTVNGGVRVDGHDGPLKVNTVNGSVEVSFAGPMRQASLETVNGSVTVTCARESSIRCTLQTTNGRIQSQFPEVTVEGKWGPKEARGAINGGRENLTVETVNGDVRLYVADAAATRK